MLGWARGKLGVDWSQAMCGEIKGFPVGRCGCVRICTQGISGVRRNAIRSSGFSALNISPEIVSRFARRRKYPFNHPDPDGLRLKKSLD